MTPSDLAYLFSLTNEYRSIKYDLANIRLLLERLGNPQAAFRSVLIAGTNGKGSVAALLSAMMPEAGVYTSPHLQRLNETNPDRKSNDHGCRPGRGSWQGDARRKRLGWPAVPADILRADYRNGVFLFSGRTAFAVVEVGMGGRLDATNVVSQDVSVITGIAADHQEFLGNTLEQIAAEKAGIIKSDEPVVIGPNADFDVIRQRAGDRLVTTADLQPAVRALPEGYFEIGVTTPVRPYKGLRPRLRGRHQIENVLIAIRAAECLNLSAEQIVGGIGHAQWPGRLEILEGAPSFLLDGAHNEQAATALCAFLEEFYPQKISMIFACMADKPYEPMLRLLSPQVRNAIFTRVAADRSKDPAELQALWPGSHVTGSVAEAIAYARETIPPSETVLVCGSLYLIGEARAMLE